jgi:hypothetical protein
MYKTLCDNCSDDIDESKEYRLVFMFPKKVVKSKNILEGATMKSQKIERHLCPQCFVRFHMLSGLSVPSRKNGK